MRFPITPQFFEATDGLLVVCFAAMTFFALVHLYKSWRGIRDTARVSLLNKIRILYYDNKPAIAHTTFAVALFLRFVILWHVRHVHDHKLPEDFITRDAAIWYFMSNALLVLAVICWCRNVSPFAIKNWVWIAGIAVTTAISIWLAQ